LPVTWRNHVMAAVKCFLVQTILADLERASRRKLSEHGCRPRPHHPAPAVKFMSHQSLDVRLAADLLNAVTFLKTQVNGHDVSIESVIRASLRAGSLSAALHLQPLIERGEMFNKKGARPKKERDDHLTKEHKRGLSYTQIARLLTTTALNGGVPMTPAAVQAAILRNKKRSSHDKSGTVLALRDDFKDTCLSIRFPLDPNLAGSFLNGPYPIPGLLIC
jgi:hypothetical protein